MDIEEQSIMELIKQLDSLKEDDKDSILKFLNRAEVVLRKIGSSKPHYVNILDEDMRWRGLSSALEWDSYKNPKKRVRAILELALEERQKSSAKAPKSKEQEAKPSNRVFLVHGHDSRMRSRVEKWLRELGLDPIILHQQPDQGRTIIEKIEAYSGVGSAIILLSPDDDGRRRRRKKKPDRFKPRARQNVILELGYFIGKLGRNKVHALYRDQKDLKLPSDFIGVLYTPFRRAKDWQSKIVRELEAAGCPIDKNKLAKWK